MMIFLGRRDPFGEARDAETALLFVLFPVGCDDLGVNDDEKVVFFFAAACVGHHNALGNTDLRRGQADARCFVHGLDHVLYQ